MAYCTEVTHGKPCRITDCRVERDFRRARHILTAPATAGRHGTDRFIVRQRFAAVIAVADVPCVAAQRTANRRGTEKTTPISTALYLAADYSVRRQFVAGAECRQKRVRSVVGAGFQSPVCAGNPQSALSAHFNRAVHWHFAVRCRRVIAAPDLKPNGKPGIIGRVFWNEYGDFAAIVRVFRPAAAVVLAGGHRRCTGRPVDFIRD